MAHFCNCMGGPNCCMNRPVAPNPSMNWWEQVYVAPPHVWSAAAPLVATKIERMQPLVYIESYRNVPDDYDDMRC